ncbi:MAG: tRNA (N6-threonylcarbamoyladenosine(37)-N6)-methyltransferase TrmO [Clostridia bacterium]|nr:tRNA (N6-threonylcarbamoyladenosine(37)-N6)-methyltransferase TrmO [Clostridia bacterium]MBQ7907116.1 tRNA (N6-threonylcarbamoyladenosine(37)-N6)-methyltransferase TrmO [Clostridia bacterium]
MEIKEIGHLRTQFKTKFGVPRQSGAVAGSLATLVLCEEYRAKEALRGLEDFSHIWVIWGFNKAEYKEFSPTVRPPRLGGNTRVGVFASRSPYRPNSLGLSLLKIEGIEKTENEGYVLHLSGADMMDGTPVYDIKPYLPQFESIPNAKGGFSTSLEDYRLTVHIPTELENKLTEAQLSCLRDALSENPRPSYIDTPSRIFGFPFESFEVKFRVEGKELFVISIE